MDKILGSAKEKTYLMENFQFWSCDLEKKADSAFLSQKGIISEKVSEMDEFWGSPKKKSICRKMSILIV